MSVRDDLMAATRAWFIGITDATDAKVIDAGADPKGPRPANPYVTVRVTTPGDGAAHGPAERIDGLTGGSAPQATMRESREATISLQGFGSTAGDWFDQAQIRMDSPGSLTLQGDNSIVVLMQTAPTDISALLDSMEERRWSMELRLRYKYEDDPVAQVALTSTEVSLELERYEGDADTLDASFALDADGNLTTPP